MFLIYCSKEVGCQLFLAVFISHFNNLATSNICVKLKQTLKNLKYNIQLILYLIYKSAPAYKLLQIKSIFIKFRVYQYPATECLTT